MSTPAGTSSNPSHRSPPSLSGPDADAFNGRRVLVMGLGRFGGGTGAARWLAGRGARVLVTDQADESTLQPSIQSLSDCDISFRLGEHRASDLDGVDLVVVSPAVVKERSPFFQEIAARRIDWTTEINLFLERCPARVIGGTGSVGKRTTAAMIDAALTGNLSAGRCYLGGNIGKSLLGDVEQMTPEDVAVLELSSFQLADLPRIERRPDVSVYLPVFPHHLDRHGSFEEYVDCKLNMIRGACARSMVMASRQSDDVASRIQRVATAHDLEMHRMKSVEPPPRLQTPGAHNLQNAQCALAAATVIGVDAAKARAAIEAFPGLPHRLQFVRRCRDVEYYNDSKATTHFAAITGLEAFERPVIAIVGGNATPEQPATLVSALQRRARAVVGFGAAGKNLADATRGCDMVCHNCLTLEEAVTKAALMAAAGDVVLFSPGHPSFDAFCNYEARGHAFIKLVNDLT